jgi:hypothetical protein
VLCLLNPFTEAFSPEVDEAPAAKEVQFQELQKDLVAFLGQHIGKVTQMQAGLLDQRPRGKGDKDIGMAAHRLDAKFAV